ncbi:hypothetical protein HOD29_02110 [archaeon]|jgi:hypothetical protein|nr:hypothetical protein [archaeon]
MKSKLKRFTNRLLLFGLLNYLLYPIITPIASTLSAPFFQNSKNIQEDIEKNKNRKHYQTFNTLDYLNLANSIVHKNANAEDDCKNFSGSTFKAYEELVKGDGRKELSNNIRFAEGINSLTGHRWLEYREEGEKKWKGYESSHKIKSPREIKNLKEFSKENPPKISNRYTKDINSFPGTKIFYPTKKSFKKGGALEVLFQMYSQGLR